MGIERWFSLQGRAAVVTGAASGLGRAIAQGLAEAGAQVLCADIDAEGAAATARSIGPRALAMAVDVADPQQVRAMIDRAMATFGALDVLVNNAGINGPSCLAHEVTLEDWQQTLAVDLTAVFVGSREALRLMVPQRRGKIVNTASVWGLLGSTLRPMPVYAAAKGAVTNLTRELALEYAPFGITVNAIAPLGFATNIAGGITFRDPEARKRLESRIPLGRVAQPEEIQALAVFLAGPGSDYLTGAVIPIDGGFSAG